MKSIDSVATLSLEPDLEKERAELDAILSSLLRRNSNMAQLLSYVCEKKFQGLSHELKEYSIAVEVFGRPADFDSSRDSIVRVEAHRLRSRLDRYYKAEGRDHEIHIVLPLGNYVPHFVRVGTEARIEQPSAELVREPGEVQQIPSEEHAVDSVPVAREPVRRWWIAAVSASLLLMLIGFAIWRAVGGSRALNASVGPRDSRSSGAMAPGSVLRILCGLNSPTFVDLRGNTWLGDSNYIGGTAEAIAPKPLVFADDPTIYFRRRRATTGKFAYHIPLEPGSYELRLHFADAFFGENNPDGGGEGSRIFDVLVNGKYVLRNFDVISDAGGANTADVKVFRDIHPGADGMLDIQFVSLQNIAFVNAIEIRRSADHGMLPLRIVTAGKPYRDQAGGEWESDRYFRGGVRSDDLKDVAKSPDEELVRHERFGNFVYSLPVAQDSIYTVAMRFHENVVRPQLNDEDPANVFDVYLNGRLLLDHFKVKYEKGASNGQLLTFRHLQPNAQGKLILSFVPIHNYALVSSIEVMDEAAAPARR